MPTIKVEIYTDGDSVEHDLPAKYEVCSSCEGSGVTCSHVECDGGGFTSSEWAEQDDDFKEDYLAGRYDRPCPDCKGKRVVLVVDEAACNPELLKLYRKQQDEVAETYRIEAMERRFGA